MLFIHALNLAAALSFITFFFRISQQEKRPIKPLLRARLVFRN